MKNSKGKTRLVVIGNGMASSAFLDELVKTDPERFDIRY
jgi:NAD(P)H-nitrite reductase large subunit